MKTIQCSPVGAGPHVVVLNEEDLTAELITSEIVYSPTSGDFFRINDGRPAAEPCQVIVKSYKKSHFAVYLFGLRVPADRLAFFCIHGQWPVGKVLHIDGDTLNNRSFNLCEQVVKESAVEVGNEGVLYDKYKGVWISYDESDLGIKPRECLTESEAIRERDSIRKEAAFVRDFEAKHGTVREKVST